MNVEKELTDALREFKKRGVDTFIAQVVSVDKNKGICKIKDDDIEYTDVRLSAVIDTKGNRFYIFPKANSLVLVSPIQEDLKQLYVEEYSEIDAVEIEIGGVKFVADSNGFLMRKGTETLYAIINDLLTAIQAMVFTTNVGATIAMVNLAQFVAIQQRLNTSGILKQN